MVRALAPLLLSSSALAAPATAAVGLAGAAAAAAAAPAPAPPSFAPLLVADNTTAVPNADGKFTFFSAPKCSGGSSFFVRTVETKADNVPFLLIAGFSFLFQRYLRSKRKDDSNAWFRKIGFTHALISFVAVILLSGMTIPSIYGAVL